MIRLNRYPFAFFLVCLAICCGTAHAQEIDTANLEQYRRPDSTHFQLLVDARYQGDSVLVRWAPATAGGWSVLNRLGYRIERRELVEDTAALRWVLLSPTPIKPQPLENWEHFGEDTTNVYPLIAAQALYGETFMGKGTESLLDRADELTNRYTFTLLAADLSYETARYAGLAYTDHTVQPGKLYAYRVMAADSIVGYLPADTGMVALQTVPMEPLPGPVVARVEEGEGAVSLFWSKSAYQSVYTAFDIERSTDGQHFEPLNSRPYLQMDNPALGVENPEFTYVDSLDENYQPHHYRLVGIDAFGQRSTAGLAVIAMGRDRTAPPPPKNLQSNILEDGSVELVWEADETEDLAGFMIGRSAENSLTGFEPLNDEMLPPSTRQYVDPAPRTDAPNYYVVLASDTARNAALSMAQHVAFVDSIPPTPPTGLAGTIDTLGVLTLSWNPSPEPDVAGYIVSYANDSTHFFTSAVQAAIPDTVYTDTLTLVTLTEDIFYRVRAVDHNDNNSAESAILMVKKPDIIPPVAPQFTDFKVEEERVSLTWVASTSDDVAAHELFRRVHGQTVWELAATIPADSTVSSLLVDSTFAPNTRYQYMLQAIDDAGLRSPESALVNIRTLRNLVVAGPTSFSAQKNTEGNGTHIEWTLPADLDGGRLVIYRAANGGAFETLESVADAAVTAWEDRTAQPGHTYEYTSKVYYTDGRASAFSAVVKVLF